MAFHVLLCLTVRSQLLLSSKTRDTYCWVATMETQPSPKEDKIFEIIDRVLKQVIGENGTRIIYEHLERRHSLSPSDFSEKTDVFAKGLEEFLSSGAILIENKILNDIITAYNSKPTIEMQIAVDVEESDFASPVKSVTQNA